MYEKYNLLETRSLYSGGCPVMSHGRKKKDQTSHLFFFFNEGKCGKSIQH